MLKVKVGGKAGPSEDASRTAELLRDLTPTMVSGSRSSTIRLDANQAWTLDEALLFSSTLAAASSAAARTSKSNCGGGRGERSGGVASGDSIEPGGSEQAKSAEVDLGLVEYIEYIEEPLRDPCLLGTFWERSGRALPYALDESLGMAREAFTDTVRVGFCSLRFVWASSKGKVASRRYPGLWRRCDCII